MALIDYSQNQNALNELIQFVESDDWWDRSQKDIHYAIFKYGTLIAVKKNIDQALIIQGIKEVCMLPGQPDADIYSFATPSGVVFIKSNRGFENVIPGVVLEDKTPSCIKHLMRLRTHYFADVQNPEIIHRGVIAKK